MVLFFEILQPVVHFSLHFLAPGLLAKFFFHERWKTAWALMLATMLVDLDHLWADPIFDPNRCSIGFHPLHSIVAIIFYALMLCIPNAYVRMIATGLLFHMGTDLLDCIWMLFSADS